MGIYLYGTMKAKCSKAFKKSELNMDKKEFIRRWDKVEDKQKVIVLKNKAQFYADNYDFTFDLSTDGKERVEFILYENEVGNCILKDIQYVV